jgi:hypothetical protein
LALLNIGAVSGSRNWDGLDGSYLQIASSTDFDAEGTICLWMKTDGNWGVDGGSGGVGTKGTATILQRGDAASQNNGTHIAMSAGGTFQGLNKTTSTICTATSAGVYNDNVWHRVCWVYDKDNTATSQLYVDGIADGSCVNTATWNFSSQVITLGDTPSNTFWEEYYGNMAEIDWYEFQMTAAQVLQDYRDHCSFNNGTNTAVCLPIFGTESPEKDFAGTGKTATINGNVVSSTDGPPILMTGGNI